MESYDVGIVGAGIHGAAAAYHLAERGVRVAVVEKTSPAGGPTGLSSVICRAYYTNDFLASCARDSISMFERFEDLTGRDAGFVRTGLLFLHPADDVEGVRASVSRLNELGIDSVVLEGAALADAADGFDLEGIAIAGFERNAGYADPHAATEGLLGRAVERGVVAMMGLEVASVVPRREGARLLLSDGSSIECGRVLLAAGPWTRRLAAQAGVVLPLTVERHIVATFRWAGVAPVPAHGDVAAGYYFRPEGEDLFLAGPLTPEPETDPDVVPAGVQSAEISRLADLITRRVPRLAGAEVHGGWASLYDVSPDWQPVIGEIAPGIYVDAGTSGHGFKLAPALGGHVAAMVMGERTDEGLAAFDPFRFERDVRLPAGYRDARILG